MKQIIITIGFVTGLFGLSCSNTGKTGSTVISSENSGYKIYIQYENIKDLKADSDVKMDGKKIGKVIAFEQNPDAVIVTLAIEDGTEIPSLSKFRIVSESDLLSYINIERSDDNRIIRANEYISGD